MRTVFGLTLFVLLGATVNAQDHVFTRQPAKAHAELITSGASSAVKNSPFSADAVSESVQVLADGNRIVRSSTSKLYRNSEGRFRREVKGGTGGALGTYFDLMPMTTITDPAGGYRFQLNTRTMTGQQLELNSLDKVKVYTTAPSVHFSGDKVSVENQAARAAVVRASEAPSVLAAPEAGAVTTITVQGAADATKSSARTEQLGTQSLEGVEAEGTRTVTTIEAGAIGNERPIEIVYERWYSKDLQLVVMSKHSDPRFGEQTYRLTNISRTEPDPSLFTVPQGYQILDREGTSTGTAPARTVRVIQGTKPN